MVIIVALALLTLGGLGALQALALICWSVFEMVRQAVTGDGTRSRD